MNKLDIAVADACSLPQKGSYDHSKTVYACCREEVLGKNCRFLQGPETSKADVETIHRAVTGQHPKPVTVCFCTCAFCRCPQKHSCQSIIEVPADILWHSKSAGHNVTEKTPAIRSQHLQILDNIVHFTVEL